MKYIRIYITEFEVLTYVKILLKNQVDHNVRQRLLQY